MVQRPTRFVLVLLLTITAGTAGSVGATASPASPLMRSYAHPLYDRPADSPQGLSAADLRSAYRVRGGRDAKIAVVTAYGYAAVGSDLATYSQVMGLPVLPDCASPAQPSCFEQTDQRGGQDYPRLSRGWALETALDVEAVHAMCSTCRIELVRADSPGTADLMAAVDQAVASGATIVSMSWGGPEFAAQITADRHFEADDVTFVAASGDSGYGTSWPAAANRVVAVGGTHLTVRGGRRQSETAWSGAGSGCSRYEAKPAWQNDAGCDRRSVADLAAVADPATGAAIYSSVGPNAGGWYVVGGTSLAAPLVAGLLGVAGDGSLPLIMNKLYDALGTSELYDVVAGSNGACGNYACTAGKGYDGPTGVGVLADPARLLSR